MADGLNRDGGAVRLCGTSGASPARGSGKAGDEDRGSETCGGEKTGRRAKSRRALILPGHKIEKPHNAAFGFYTGNDYFTTRR